MGYQESYVTSNSKENFEKLLKKIQSMGNEYYDKYGTYPVEIITFNKPHEYFQKGQQAIYFVGERYLQRSGKYLIGCTEEEFNNLTDDEINTRLKEAESYFIITSFTEDIDPKGVWADAGDPLFVTHEPFNFDEEYEFPENTWKLSTSNDDVEYDEEYEYDDCFDFLVELRLRNYPNCFDLVDANVRKEYFEDEDEDEDEVFFQTHYEGTYYDPIKNNTLILDQVRYDDEETESMDVVVNAISNEAYNYLIKELNKNNNVTVFWSQVYGTTSDYIIVYDNFGEDCLYDENYLHELFKKECGYKYNYVKNGKIYKITPETMGKVLK